MKREKEILYCIYCITNNINGKTYIGQHKTNNLDDSYMGSGVLLKRAKEKYGLENFSKEILAIVGTKENADILEKVFIALYREMGKVEYNVADGGQGGNLGEEVNVKRGKLLKGKKAWNKGIPCTDEVKEKLRKIHLGSKHKKFSEDGKRKISEAHKGKHHSEETKKKISESHKGHFVSDEQRKKQSEKLKGREFTDEHRMNLSKSLKGKLSGNKNPNYGKHWSKDKIEQIRNSNIGKHNIKLTDEQKLKISISHKGKKFTDEHKKNLSNSKKGLKAYNNGVVCVMRIECPEGFVRGRLK